jgi:predicted CopG family antitoxin
MKNLNETFTDEEFEKLKQAKGKLSWHDFILQLAKEGKNQ